MKNGHEKNNNNNFLPMDSNFKIDPFDLEVLKLHFNDADHLNICVRCKEFDYRGKSMEETIKHIETC